MSNSLTSAQSLRIEARDPRADNRQRVIDVARDGVVIRRSVAGVAMAICVASSAYRGVALRVTGLHEGRFRYEARLLHRDPDLSVNSAAGEDQTAIETVWREWVRFMRLPALVGRTETGDVEVNIDVTDIAHRRPSPRRRGKALACAGDVSVGAQGRRLHDRRENMSRSSRPVSRIEIGPLTLPVSVCER